MDIGAVNFDLDGTLLDDDRAVTAALPEFGAFFQASLPVAPEDLATRACCAYTFSDTLRARFSFEEQWRARIRELCAMEARTSAARTG
jgi:phosphoglycolate phosphatase-like HAD superfamily hydrolase